MKTDAQLMADFNNSIRQEAVKKEKEISKLKVANFKAPYIMKFTDQCDYFK